MIFKQISRSLFLSVKLKESNVSTRSKETFHPTEIKKMKDLTYNAVVLQLKNNDMRLKTQDVNKNGAPIVNDKTQTGTDETMRTIDVQKIIDAFRDSVNMYRGKNPEVDYKIGIFDSWLDNKPISTQAGQIREWLAGIGQRQRDVFMTYRSHQLQNINEQNE